MQSSYKILLDRLYRTDLASESVTMHTKATMQILMVKKDFIFAIDFVDAVDEFSSFSNYEILKEIGKLESILNSKISKMTPVLGKNNKKQDENLSHLRCATLAIRKVKKI